MNYSVSQKQNALIVSSNSLIVLYVIYIQCLDIWSKQNNKTVISHNHIGQSLLLKNATSFTLSVSYRPAQVKNVEKKPLRTTHI